MWTALEMNNEHSYKVLEIDQTKILLKFQLFYKVQEVQSCTTTILYLHNMSGILFLPNGSTNLTLAFNLTIYKQETKKAAFLSNFLSVLAKEL